MRERKVWKVDWLHTASRPTEEQRAVAMARCRQLSWPVWRDTMRHYLAKPEARDALLAELARLGFGAADVEAIQREPA